MGAVRQRVIEASNDAFLRLRRNRRIDPRDLVPAGTPVKINLGSGLEVAPGWINLDASPNAMLSRWPTPALEVLYKQSGSNVYMGLDEYVTRLKSNRFIHHELTSSLPFVDASVNYIFSSHFVEHLTRPQCVIVLSEALRVLHSDGVIRIGAPDLEVAIDLYAHGEQRRMLDDFFYRPETGRLAQHRYMYDFSLLADILHEVGFVSVERRMFHEGQVPDLDLLDNRPEQTLFVEARRASPQRHSAP